MMPPKLLKHTHVGEMELRLFDSGKEFRGVILKGSEIEFDVRSQKEDEVWRQLHDRVAKLNPSYVGFEGARNRFLQFFPNGFHSDGYVTEERDYKIKAKRLLDETVPLGDAAEGSGFGEAILAVFRETNLLFRIEKARVQELLRGPNADDFVRAAARFALGETRSGLAGMEAALKRHHAASWTAATYLPFLWRPEAHMFLKPEVTKDFAARVGHRFALDYDSRLRISVYETLLDLVAITERDLEDLQPRDRIDIQSFIWVVDDYKDEGPKT